MIPMIVKKIIWRSRGKSIFEREWNDLIILDACRYDTFVEVATEFGIHKVEKVRSCGSCTCEFLRENFKEYWDVVYVTANPFASLLLKDKVYKIIPVWRDYWNEELKTVLPQDVFRVAIKAKMKYGKRMIVHFMQPHEPYLTLHNVEITGFKRAVEAAEGKRVRERDRCIWDLVREGKFPEEIAVKAYYDNLRLVLPYALKLAKRLLGKTVITSDHGEGLGDRVFLFRLYGHPERVYVPALVEVPWLEVVT